MLKYLFCSTYFICSFLFLKGQDIKTSPTPKWVESIELPKESKISKYDVNSGFYPQLMSYQVNGATEEQYSLTAFKIFNQGGVQALSNLAIAFDTSYQSLLFHELKILRDGKEIDKTDEVKFTILNQEENLDQGIYTGAATAFYIMEDLRAGDVLLYAYTLKGNNPIFGDNEHLFFGLQGSNPLDKLHLRYIKSPGKEYKIRCYGCEDQEEKIAPKSAKEINITRTDIEAGNFEESAPSWIFQSEFLEITTFDSWDAVKSWSQALFPTDTSFAVDAQVKDLLTSSKKLSEKVNDIVEYVQNDIRYMGIESGIGAIKPSNPAKVLEQRFGDCKDKSYLLCALLQKIGVSASPVLVNNNMSHGLEQLLPSGFIFDHCVVTLNVKGKDYYIDPTMSNQGGTLARKFFPDYGYGFVVFGKEKGLRKLPFSLENGGKSIVTERIKFTDFESPGEMVVTTTLTGFRADIIRTLFDYYSKKEITKTFREEYSIVFPGISETQDIVIREDEDKNEIVIEEFYKIKNPWKREVKKFMPVNIFHYEPRVLYNYVNTIGCNEKRFDIAVPFPSYYEQKTEIIFPNPLNIAPQIDEIDNEAFSYTISAEVKGLKALNINYLYEAKTRSITPVQFDEICPQINTLVGNLPLEIYFPVTE